MKKALLLLFSTFLLNCSSDSETPPATPTVENQVINPPAWIQGEWKYVRSSGVVQNDGFTFGSNWFTKFTTRANRYESYQYTVKETITETTYDVILDPATTYSQEFHFIKLSNTKIKWLNPDEYTNNTFTKQ